MNTFTAQELADFYQQVADGGEIQLYLIRPPENQPKWEDSKNGPNLASDPDMWRIKPKLKPVDMSVLIASGIDCEFTSRSDKSHWYIGKLRSIDSFYYPTWNAPHIYCHPRMNHIHAWQGGECPLPEGFRVRAFLRKKGAGIDGKEVSLGKLEWNHEDCRGDIIGFEVLGLDEGYCWPWEVE